MIQRLAIWSYITIGSVQKKVCPCPHNPDIPVKMALICCGPNNDFPVALSKTCHAVFMVSTTWVAPAARLLSEGIPSREAPLAEFGIPSKFSPIVAETGGGQKVDSSP